jgi:hypothetical protein
MWMGPSAGVNYIESGNTAFTANAPLYISGYNANVGSLMTTSFVTTALMGGKVGIGTTTPSEKLEVIGNIKGTQLCIGTDCRSAWPGSGGGGTVTSVASGTGLTGGPITGSGTLAVDVGTTANKIVQLDASAKLPAVDGSALTNLNASNLTSGTVPAARMPALTGDVTSTAGSATTTLAKIQGKSVTISSLASGDYLKYNGTGWVNDSLSSADLSDASSLIKSSQMPANCAAGQTLTFSSPTGAWTCSNIVVTASNFGSQTQNTFLAAPNGSNGTPTFRAIASADLPSGTLSGSGTAGYVPYYSAASTLANSGIYQSSGNVGIGTTAPSEKLDVNGKIKATQLCINSDCKSAWPSSGGSGDFKADGSVAMTGSLNLGGNLITSNNDFVLIGDGTNDTIALAGPTIVGSTLQVNSGIIEGPFSSGLTLTSQGLQVSAAPSTSPAILRLTAGGGLTEYVWFDGDGSRPDWSMGRSSDDSDNFEISPTGSLGNTFVISTGGYVGIGTTSPGSKLDVAGQSRSINSSGITQINASAAVDWNNGNVQSLSVSCTSTAFTNMLDGGTYVLAVTETGTSTCIFAQSGLTFYYSPANGARVSGKRTVYTFQRIGSDVYVAWIKGFE